MTNPIQELIKRQDDILEKKFAYSVSKGMGWKKPKGKYALGKTEDLQVHTSFSKLKEYFSQCRQELLDEVVKMIGEQPSYWRHPMALFLKERTKQEELVEMKSLSDLLTKLNKKTYGNIKINS